MKLRPLFSFIYFFLVPLLLGSILVPVARGESYPAHWWAPVAPEEAYEWEVLPQEAKPGEVILSKRNELGLFSNFAPTPIWFDGKYYPCLEGFWQMMKYPENDQDPRANYPGIKWKFSREEVSQMSGFAAKEAGDLASHNMRIMGINWVTYNGNKMIYRTTEKGEHYQLIRKITQEKLKQHPELMKLLKQTGDLILRPDHKTSPDDPPAWKYFQIYMEIRDHQAL